MHQRLHAPGRGLTSDTMVVMRESTACPGCGLELPPNRWAVPPRSYASSECVELSGDVVGFESEHFELVRDHHQLFVDAYLAQLPRDTVVT